MGKLKVLFIGGTGVISSACVREAVEQRIELFVLNRGQSAARPLPAGVTELRGDVREPASVRAALEDLDFDSVVDWVAFTPEHVRADVELFRDRTAQYVFISTASAYQKPASRLPITESTPLRNPYWQYSRDKIACEDLLVAEYRDNGFPATIVRPSHTYDATKTVLSGGWTSLARMLAGKPVIVHGDGTSLWTVTHNTDFARAFVPLLGHPRTYGEAFHITSDDVLTWDQIALRAGGRARRDAAHRARAVGRHRGARPGVGRRAARGQDPLDGVRQREDQVRGARLAGGRAVRAGRAGDRAAGTWRTPRGRSSTSRLDALMDKLAAGFGTS